MPLLGLPPYIPGPGDGLPGHFTLPGSGFAIPAGIEAALEFNGLYLNIQQNADRYRVTNIDGLGDSDIRDTRDTNSNDDGETPYNSFLGGRSIVITGTIETYSVSKLRDMQMALRAAFADVTQERPLYFRLGDFNKDHFIMCKKVGSISMAESQQNARASRDFQIPLRASNPRIMAYYGKSFYATPAATPTPVVLGTLVNRGNYWAQPVYRIWGPSFATTISNDTTGQSFTIANVPLGTYFQFSTVSPSPTLRDGFNSNQWNNLADDSDFVLLKGSTPDYPSGENVIFYQGDTPRVDIAWYDSWV